MDLTTQLSYWIFQFIPDEGNRDIESGGAGTNVDWRLTAHKDDVRINDIVFFWRASRAESALIGWGEVAGSPFEDSEAKVTRIRVTTRARFPAPIWKQDLQSHPQLSTVGVFSGRQGTNFRLSIEQAGALIDLMQSRGLERPEFSREAFSDSLNARIQRGLRDLGKIAETLPESDLRSSLQSTIKSAASLPADSTVTATEIAERVRGLSDQVIAMQRDGKWVSSANVDSVASQVATDLEQLNDLVASFNAPTDAPLPVPRPIIIKRDPGNASPAAADQPSATPTVPDDHWYRAWEKEDLVGIKQYVSNLARYIVHQELVPPRSIGIFGDWGSGKSFFLRALRSDIALYAHQSRTARQREGQTVFCGNVVQIEFNAWHFVESNLWASIAGYVFEQLYAELERSSQAHTNESDLNALYKSLDLYKEAIAEREELEKEVLHLSAERDKIEASAQRKVLDREQRMRGLYEAAKKAAQKAFDDIPEHTKKSLAKVASVAQIDKAEQAITEAKHVVDEGRSTFGRIRLAMQAWGLLGLTVATGIVLSILFGIPALAAFAADMIPSLEPKLAAAGSYVVLGSVALTWLSGKAKGPIKIANSVLDILSAAEEEARQEERAKLELLDGEVDTLKKKLASTDLQIIEHRRLIAEARDAIDPRNLGTKLRRFLEERARSKGYEQHLGLITLVRRDLEALSKLMREHWGQRLQKIPEVILQVDDAIGVASHRVPFIERIVLYIDDLDRCPPQKVVEVLQAVHLMLGFPLFVVVVAVDVRWVRESLLKHYPDLLSNAALVSESTAQSTQLSQRAQADDYLEKIFQIPFRIPRLDRDDAERLVKGLLKEPFLTATPPNMVMNSASVLDLTPQELKLYPAEELAIAALSHCIGLSPRRVRRFLDQYLIMRAGMEDGDVQLITQTTNQYQSILGLFAMLSGAANAAPSVLQKLYSELALSTGGAPIALGLSNWVMNNVPANQHDAYEVEALRHAADHMDRAEPDRDKLSQSLTKWIPEVARYSFREVRL